jgi:hypothetical protein
MYCEGDRLYVVKLFRNPRGSRALVCEYLASKIGRWAGLPLPRCDVIEVSPFLLRHGDELSQATREEESAAPENILHFGSRVVGGMRGGAYDMLPASYLASMSSHAVFGGMLTFDKFWSKLGDRQAVFRRPAPGMEYKPYFIDHDDCFGGAAWNFRAPLMDGIFRSRDVYSNITGLESFEPYLTQCVEGMTLDLLWTFCKCIPASWYGSNKNELDAFIESLRHRVTEVHSELVRLRDQGSLFPNWRRSTQSRPMRLYSYTRNGDMSGVPSEV